jgi:hypothetical protein
MSGSVIDGEDLVQEVVVKAIDAFSRLAPIAHLEGGFFGLLTTSSSISWRAVDDKTRSSLTKIPA